MGQVKPTVKLIKATAQPAEVISAAGKLCYATDCTNITEQNEQEADKFVNMIMGIGHMSIFEHAVFTFYIEGVSRAMTHQLVRHRLASYSQRSQRYVNHDSFDYIIPPQLQGKKVEVDGQKQDAVEYFTETMATIAEHYSRLNKALGSQGEKSNEDARYVLPNACETKIFVTMNARELIHFLEERTCLRAQWEIRSVADQILKILRREIPVVFNKIGPKCVRAKRCPEGKMTCGNYQDIIEKYSTEQS